MNGGGTESSEFREEFANVGIGNAEIKVGDNQLAGNAEIKVGDNQLAGSRFANDSATPRSVILKIRRKLFVQFFL